MALGNTSGERSNAGVPSLDALQARDVDAMSDLYSFTLEVLQRYEGQLTEEDHHDVAQDIVLRIVRRIEAGLVREDQDLGAWIPAIAKNAVARVLRERRLDELTQALEGKVQVAASIGEDRGIQELVLVALSRLPEEQSNILIASLLHRMSSKELASTLNLNPSSVATLRYQALRRLRDELLEIGRDSSLSAVE